MAFAGVALWLVPSDSSVDTALSAHIDHLSQKYATPRFSPHVTLLTGISIEIPRDVILAAMESSVIQWRAGKHETNLTLNYAGLGSKAAEGNFFQYLFVKIDPSNALLAALRAAVRRVCLPSLAPETDDYFPHLSLMYGKDDENRNAKEIIGELEEEEGAVWTVGSFAAAEILLIRAEGPPKVWEVMGRFSL